MSKSSKSPKKLPPVIKKAPVLKLSGEQFFALLARFGQASEMNLAQTQALRQQVTLQTEAIVALGEQVITLFGLLEKLTAATATPAAPVEPTPADDAAPVVAPDAPAANEAAFSDDVPSPATLESEDRQSA